MRFTVREVCDFLKGKLEGDPERVITGVAKIEEANPEDISFLANPKYLPYLTTTRAGALIISETLKVPSEVKAALIRVENPYESFSKVLELFNHNRTDRVGIDTTASIDKSAFIGEAVYVGAYSVVEKNAKIHDRARIYPHVYIGEGVEIGEGTVIYSGVRIYAGCKIGRDCIIHSGAVIGSDGFGFAPTETGAYRKIPQTGIVIVGNQVEIGANTTIDRATIGATVIHDGVKIDNLVQIAHNVEIGEHTVIAAQTGISGSTRIGKHCRIGGQAGFVGHISVADYSSINAQSGVSKSIKEPGKAWTGSPAGEFRATLKLQAMIKRLPELEKRIEQLEKLLHQSRNNQDV